MFAQAGSHAYFSLPENRTCNVNYFCFGSLLIFIGTILYATLGLFVMFPYLATHHWTQITCNVTYSGLSQEYCACEKDIHQYPNCPQNYPCLQIYVTHFLLQNTTATHENINRWNVWPTEQHIIKSNQSDADASYVSRLRLQDLSHKNYSFDKMPGNVYYDTRRVNSLSKERFPSVKTADESASSLRPTATDTLVFRSWKDIYFQHCTLQECGDQVWNTKSAREYQLNYGNPGESLSCFMDPSLPSNVILHPTPWPHFFHALLWPGLCVLVGALIWITLFCGCCVSDPQESDSCLSVT